MQSHQPCFVLKLKCFLPNLNFTPRRSGKLPVVTCTSARVPQAPRLLHPLTTLMPLSPSPHTIHRYCHPVPSPVTVTPHLPLSPSPHTLPSHRHLTPSPVTVTPHPPLSQSFHTFPSHRHSTPFPLSVTPHPPLSASPHLSSTLPALHAGTFTPCAAATREHDIQTLATHA